MKPRSGRSEARMHDWDQKCTVIFGGSGRAPKMTLEDSAYTRILFILSVYFADLKSGGMVTEIAFEKCRLLAVAVSRLFGASHSCFVFTKSFKSGSFCVPN